MAASIGVQSGSPPSSSSTHMRSALKKNQKRNRVSFVSASSTSSIADPYATLRICPGASEYEVKKAFRRLALQYHPDVCRADNCTVNFHQINEAYDVVLNQLREESLAAERESYYDGGDDSDLWEEWMGWEGAGIRDYSSHINPYI